MKRFIYVLTVIALLTVSVPLYADYKFDDIAGPSGRSYQWMILNQANDTFGDSHTTAIDVAGDVISTGDAVLNVLSGTPDENTVDDRSLNTLFLTAVEGTAEFTMNFRAVTLDQQFDVATPNLQLSTPWNEQATMNELYIDTKQALGQPSGRDYDGLWRSYNFQLSRTNTAQYDSVAQYFYFQHNPTNTPSQGIPRPMVIANVGLGAADTIDRSLKLRAILRDSSSNNANIVAYDQFTWTMTGPKTAGNSQWVFVPVDDLNTDNSQINYYLTTEVINRCAYRYAAYNGITNQLIYPSTWKFNILRLHDSPYIARSFQLDPDSHIAPGLVTVYRRPYNVNEIDKIPLRLFPIDDPSGIGVHALTMNHNILFGKRLGETYKLAASEGGFNQLEVTAFQPRTQTGSVFYDNVARITGSTRLGKTVAAPTTNIFTGSSIKRTQTAGMPSSALQYFTIEQSIPANLRTASVEGILPLHITFNIPVTMTGSEVWNALLRELARHEDDADISDAFADYFNIYLQAEQEEPAVSGISRDNRANRANVWNLTQELVDKGVYRELVKVFLDEERGRITRDADRGVLTVSFIVMLMDGMRDGLRPEMSIVSDGDNVRYVVVRDGLADSKWKMTFFIAPGDYFDNFAGPDSANNNVPQEAVSSTSGGGGGCDAIHLGFVVLSFLTFCVLCFIMVSSIPERECLVVDKSFIMDGLRSVVAQMDKVLALANLYRRSVCDFGFAFESRIDYFVSLAIQLMEMSSEAICDACNLIAEDAPLKEDEERVLKSWTAEELGVNYDDTENGNRG